jgi:hypothetical protein
MGGCWISQVLGCNSSCSHAVSSVQSWPLKAKLPAISSKTKAFCNARLRLPLAFIDSVSRQVLSVLNTRVRSKDLWHEFIVKSVAGSSTQLMDTGGNQKKFPQPSNQKKHCGFPVMKFLGLLNHSTGAWEKHLTAHPDEHDARTMKKLISHLTERCLLLATTLLDTRKYDWIEILNLYATRWEIELRLRDLKTTMKMEALNVKTPEMAKKSLAMALLGYNLVKAVSQEKSRSEGVELKLISFKGVLDWISSTTSLFHEIKNQTSKVFKNLYASFLETAATKLIDHRPYRWEPRAIKKRPKPFPRLTESRSSLREKREAGDLIPA